MKRALSKPPNFVTSVSSVVDRSVTVKSSGGFVAYYRVSTVKQGMSGLGLEAQKEAITHYAKTRNAHAVAEFTEVESGRKQNRPELEEALRVARLHRVALVVAKLDRLTRSSAFLHKLIESGVDIRFCDLPAVEGPQGRFLLQSMVSVAELEAGLISARTKAALRAAKARGVKLGGNRGSVISRAAQAVGRKTSQRKAHERASELAPIMFEMRSRGLSLNAMARELSEKGIPTARTGQHWNPVQVKRVIERLNMKQ